MAHQPVHGSLATNSLPFNPGTTQRKTISLVFNAAKTMVQALFNVRPYDIDWNGSGGKTITSASDPYYLPIPTREVDLNALL